MKTVDVAKKDAWHLDLWKTSPSTLHTEFGDEPVVIIMARGFNMLLPLTKWILRECTGPNRINILWNRDEDQGFAKPMGYPCASMYAIRSWIDTYRPGGEGVWFIMSFMACNHTWPWWLKHWFPKCRVIPHVYDPMNLWVPRQLNRLWDAYELSKGSNDAEYEALDELLTGQYVDGWLYKDYGINWPYLSASRRPMAWFPSVQSRSIFQNPAPDPPNRFIFIGTIMSKKTHGGTSGLFDDIFMEEPFDRIVRQGYQIHGYLSIWDNNTDEEILPLYRNRFPHGEVQLFNGTFLPNLLPRIRGRYKWGWMLYDFPQPVIMDLISNTLPTKFFTYMALGVPTVVNEEFEAVARIVERERIGVVVSANDHTRLETILKKINYKELVKNILLVREAYCVEKFEHILGGLIQEISKNPPAEAPDTAPWIEKDREFFKHCLDVWQQKGFLNAANWRDNRGAESVGCFEGPAPYR